MDVLETIYRWSRRFKPKLDRLPFDELARRYPREELQVWTEFHRRLNKIVLNAAVEYVDRTRGTVSQQEVEEKMMQVFDEFAPRFASGNPDMLLRRFAAAIRRVLDDEAFESIAYRYYYHLPIYHLEDDQQRRVLAACYENALNLDVAKQMSERFMITVAEAERIIDAANRSLSEVIANDFTPQELSKLTEGYVP
jgi:hypothetical protein